MSMSSTSFPPTTSPVPAPSSRLESHEVNPLSGKRVDVAARPLRRVRPLCAECQRRPAVTCVRGRRVVLDDHDMCRQCWRARMDARRPTRRARRLERWSR